MANVQEAWCSGTPDDTAAVKRQVIAHVPEWTMETKMMPMLCADRAGHVMLSDEPASHSAIYRDGVWVAAPGSPFSYLPPAMVPTGVLTTASVLGRVLTVLLFRFTGVNMFVIVVPTKWCCTYHTYTLLDGPSTLAEAASALVSLGWVHGAVSRELFEDRCNDLHDMDREDRWPWDWERMEALGAAGDAPHQETLCMGTVMTTSAYAPVDMGIAIVSAETARAEPLDCQCDIGGPGCAAPAQSRETLTSDKLWHCVQCPDWYCVCDACLPTCTHEHALVPGTDPVIVAKALETVKDQLT